ncbi:MAG TPA: glycosyltransferase [Acidimicrobiales bacterium]|nr:glycosyltransferase [Acidimicrobiales bacterium]
MSQRDAPISIVVATRDRPVMLRDCLDSLAASLGPRDEVLVVDSCSRERDTGEVARRAGARLVRAPVPGASLARNLGWRSAAWPVVAFVDDDVRVTLGWADALRATFAAHPETSFVTGRLGLRPEDSDAERPVAHFAPDRGFVVDASLADDLGHGANLAVRRAALARVGGYDEQLGPGTRWHAAEDLELIDRLLAAGCTGLHEPSAAAVHVQWRGRRDLLRLEWRYGLGQGARLGRLRRLDPGRFAAVRRIVWHVQGWQALGRSLRQGHEFETLSTVLRLAGTAFGQLGAAAVTGRRHAARETSRS